MADLPLGTLVCTTDHSRIFRCDFDATHCLRVIVAAIHSQREPRTTYPHIVARPAKPPEQCRGESLLEWARGEQGPNQPTSGGAIGQIRCLAWRICGVCALHLRRMRGASAAHARCMRAAAVLIGSTTNAASTEDPSARRTPSGQRSCSSRVDTPRLRCASPADTPQQPCRYAVPQPPLHRGCSAAEVLPRPVVRSRSRAASGTRTRRGIRGCCRWLYGWRFEHLMRSVAAVYCLSRRSVRLRQCRDAHAVITLGGSAGSQQAEEDKERPAWRAISCPAAPPVVLTDVLRILCPDLVACQRTRTPNRLLARLAVRRGCSENLLPGHARRHAKSRTGGLPAPSCTASRDGLWSSL